MRGKEEIKKTIEDGKAVLGIEFGSYKKSKTGFNLMRIKVRSHPEVMTGRISL